MNIALGSDHGGYLLKEHIKAFVSSLGHQVTDTGTFSTESTDYPLFGFRTAELVAEGRCERGIVFCTTGIGISIAANKVPGIRAALCSSVSLAQAARKHNDANVLALGAVSVTETEAEEITKIFLEQQFEGGRHERRVNMLDSYGEASS